MREVCVVIRKVNSELVDAHFDALLGLLYPKRREAVLRFKNRRAAIVSLSAGKLLQDIAGRECSILPDDLNIEKGSQGKPYIAGRENFHFNLSHSGDYVVIAYGDCELGVDIEQLRDKDIAVARRCFTPEEFNYVVEGAENNPEICASEAANERFFRIWTMKESYLKCTGTGISIPLNSFYANPYNLAVENTNYRFDVHRADDYIISLCTQGKVFARYVFDDEWI